MPNYGGRYGFDWVKALNQGPYWMEGGSEAGEHRVDSPNYSQAQAIQQAFAAAHPGMLALPEEFIGGTASSRLNDPSKIQQDDFGYFTDAGNVKDNSDFLSTWGPWLMAAIPAAGIIGGAMAGGEAAAGTAAGSEGLFATLPEFVSPATTLPEMASIPSFGAAGASMPAGLFDTMPQYAGAGELPAMSQGPSFGADAFAGAQATGSVDDIWSRMLGPLANPSELPAWAMNNPGDALRIAMGLGSLVNSATQGRGDNGSAGSSLPWQNGQIPSYMPSLQPFQPNPNLFSKVPFMGGR